MIFLFKKSKFLLIISSVFLLDSNFHFLIANQDGISGYSGNLNTNGGMNCNSSLCHQGGLSPSVKIEGPKAVAPESINKFKVTMNSMSSNIRNVGGIGISVSAGLGRVDSTTAGELIPQNLTVTSKPSVAGVGLNEIVHKSSQPVMIDGSTVTWYFDWKAPATLGNISLYVSALAGDNDLVNNSNVPAAPDKATAKGDRATTNVYTVAVTDKVLNSTFEYPKAVISAPLSVIAGDKVQLIGSNSISPIGIITEYKWMISEKNNINGMIRSTELSGEQIEYVFKESGTASVILTIITDQKLNSRFIDAYSYLDIQVLSSNTSSGIIPTSRITGAVQTRVGAVVEFSGILSSTNSSNIDSTLNNISHYIWDFGDTVSSVPESSGIDPNISHVFSKAGEYWVTLAVQSNGLINVSRMKVNVAINITDSIISGKDKFNTTCAAADCHAVDGLVNSTVTPNIKSTQGATLSLIKESILNVPVMKIYAERYTALELQNIADFLSSGAKLSNQAGKEIQDGQALFTIKCQICHGITAEGITARGRAILGESQSRILQAINNQNPEPGLVTVPLMSGINLSSNDASLIEQFLNISVLSDATAGKTTFIKECQMCHGTGTGGSARSIINMTIAKIKTALKNIQAMQPIKARLKQPDIQNLENFLLTPGLTTPSSGVDLYDMYCSYCHGARGKGSNIAGDITKLPYTGKDISNAYKPKSKIPQMANTNLKKVSELTPLALDNIASYLKSQKGVK